MANNADGTFDPDKTKDDVTRHLEQRFPDHEASELHEVASDTVDQLAAHARVTSFIDTVAEHEAAERLRKADAAD
jgi:hypothetical protein